MVLSHTCTWKRDGDQWVNSIETFPLQRKYWKPILLIRWLCAGKQYNRRKWIRYNVKYGCTYVCIRCSLVISIENIIVNEYLNIAYTWYLYGRKSIEILIYTHTAFLFSLFQKFEIYLWKGCRTKKINNLKQSFVGINYQLLVIILFSIICIHVYCWNQENPIWRDPRPKINIHHFSFIV